MPTLDLKREHRAAYAPSAKAPTVVSVPDLNYLMIDGQGDPGGPEFAAASETLYPVAYALKFQLKHQGLDFSVMPLEGLWWMGDNTSFDLNDRAAWRWTLMIAVPDAVTPADVARAVANLKEKGKPLPAVARLRLERLHEGQAAQIMHVGPYAEEVPTVERLHAYIQEHGWRMEGKHHEIYLGDPRRSAPEKLKTIIRYPVSQS